MDDVRFSPKADIPVWGEAEPNRSDGQGRKAAVFRPDTT
jgi:hypothetical protein